jgi:hypothetical protein
MTVVADAASGSPVLLAGSDRTTRTAFYSALASATGALLGFAVTALSILVALPSRPAIEALRRYSAWKALHWLLLTTAGLLALTLVLSLVGTVYDVESASHGLFAHVAFAAAVASLLAILASGLFFGLVIAYTLGAGLGGRG